jgi:hypothetical protein
MERGWKEGKRRSDNRKGIGKDEKTKEERSIIVKG